MIIDRIMISKRLFAYGVIIYLICIQSVTISDSAVVTSYNTAVTSCDNKI